MNSLQAYIGYAAGILGFIPFIFLVISMRKGITKPNLAGWTLYMLAMIMIVTSSIALDAWQAVWLAVAYVIGQAVVISVSFKTVFFSFTKFDYLCVVVSILSLCIWLYTDNPLYALVINVGIDALGSLAIARKLYKYPGTEDTPAWSIALAVSVLNLFAVASFDLSNALYPVVIVISNVVIVALSLRKKLNP